MKTNTSLAVLLVTARAFASALDENWNPPLDITERSDSSGIDAIVDQAWYCSFGNIMGGGKYGSQYMAQCGLTYQDQTIYPSAYFTTASSYIDCLNQCDNDLKGWFFSYNLTLATDNCYIVDVPHYIGDPESSANSDIDSGYWNGG